MNALNGVGSGHLNEGPKNLRSEFARLVRPRMFFLLRWICTPQVVPGHDMTLKETDSEQKEYRCFGQQKLEGRKGVRVRTITPS